MKKNLIFLISVIIIFTMSSCSHVKERQDNSAILESPSSESNIDSKNPSISKKDISCVFMHDAVECQFLSVKDLEMYLFTGSSNPLDYSNPPIFENFPEIDGYETNEYAKKGYLSLKELFEINPDNSETFDLVSFQITADYVKFNYYFKTSYISITYSPECFSNQVTSDYFSSYCEYISKDYVMNDYGSIEKINGGYVSRKIDDCEIVYTVKNGLIRKASLMLNNYFIEITTASSSNEAIAKQEYNTFISSQETASIAPLFLDDSQNALKMVKQLEDSINKNIQ